MVLCLSLQNSGLVTHSLTLQTASESSPVAAEKQAFVRLLTEAKGDFPNVKVVTTDGHLGIASYMRNSEHEITHNQVSCFTIWFDRVAKKCGGQFTAQTKWLFFNRLHK